MRSNCVPNCVPEWVPNFVPNFVPSCVPNCVPNCVPDCPSVSGCVVARSREASGFIGRTVIGDTAGETVIRRGALMGVVASPPRTRLGCGDGDGDRERERSWLGVAAWGKSGHCTESERRLGEPR